MCVWPSAVQSNIRDFLFSHFESILARCHFHLDPRSCCPRTQKPTIAGQDALNRLIAGTTDVAPGFQHIQQFFMTEK